MTKCDHDSNKLAIFLLSKASCYLKSCMCVSLQSWFVFYNSV